MTEKEKMLSRKVYKASDKELTLARIRVKKLLFDYNRLSPDQYVMISMMIHQILGKTKSRVSIEQPFKCDYGFNISVGENFYSNVNCVMLDAAPITIGDNVMLGPNVSLYTTGHAIHPELRSQGWEHAAPISIGDNVWIGGNTVIIPGVDIGSNTVIGAGSVVTKDIPGWVVAGGNPCRVIRPITEQDRIHCCMKGQTLEWE